MMKTASSKRPEQTREMLGSIDGSSFTLVTELMEEIWRKPNGDV